MGETGIAGALAMSAFTAVEEDAAVLVDQLVERLGEFDAYRVMIRANARLGRIMAQRILKERLRQHAL